MDYRKGRVKLRFFVLVTASFLLAFQSLTLSSTVIWSETRDSADVLVILPHVRSNEQSQRAVNTGQHGGVAQQQQASEESLSNNATTTLDGSSFYIHEKVFVPLWQRHVETPVPVVLYPYVILGSMGRQDETVAIDGLGESPYLTLLPNVTDTLYNFGRDTVWVADQGAARAPPPIWCRNLAQHIREVKAKRMQQEALSSSWPLHSMQVASDSTAFLQCEPMKKQLKKEHVKFFKRSIVVEREWNETKQWVNVGRRYRYPNLKHLAIPVRTDIVGAIATTLQQQSLSLDYPIETLTRPMDVVHFWPLQDNRTKEVNRDDGRLRDMVSHVVANLTGTVIHESNSSRPIKLFVDVAGAGREAGRNSPQTEYVQRLLQAKIVVVAQRDGWEDHYRLLEGLVAGALVMTDQMLTLPTGLKNGVSIVEYTSAEDLSQRILYYLQNEQERLAMAARGRDIAMRRHRSWHRMEEVVFGRPVSVCEEDSTSCSPWVVHAREMYSA